MDTTQQPEPVGKKPAHRALTQQQLLDNIERGRATRLEHAHDEAIVDALLRDELQLQAAYQEASEKPLTRNLKRALDRKQKKLVSQRIRLLERNDEYVMEALLHKKLFPASWAQTVRLTPMTSCSL